ncbi:MAG: hypothetical protein JW751_20395 [Polyangiaceae bacterium]|nr:hypothetical protein [Polyangiaceae bacterium]
MASELTKETLEKVEQRIATADEETRARWMTLALLVEATSRAIEDDAALGATVRAMVNGRR